MQIQTVDTPLLQWTGDAIALGLFKDQTELTGDLAQLDAQLNGAIAELISETEFEGKSGSKASTRVGSNSAVRKVILVGLGEQANYDVTAVRMAGTAITRLAKQQRVKTLGIALSSTSDMAQTAQVLSEACHLALHVDDRFKSEKEPALKLEAIDLLGLGVQADALAQAQAIVSGVILARELVAAPANAVTPITLAETAQSLASDYGLELEILEQADCEALGMGSYLGVARASDLPPKFIHLTYKPNGTPRKKLAIVGKGLTFDSGGLNLKVGPSSSIDMMKMDMGGAGATFGAAKAIAQLKPDVEVHFISAATENMVSGRAMHPGDILTASNGKTIEVNNTDAEGRLTLADALVFAEKLEVDAIVDLATLTGACIISLGNDIGGLWSTDDALAEQFKTAAYQSSEKFWQMPLEESYFGVMKSQLADMKNAGSRAGGSITAALFLKQFIENTPWAHMDIAGPVWADKENDVTNSGATGYPVRTLVNWVLN
ncbi:MAG: leucyl aminopeptidase [Spirulina sp. SIO3F2]|nr:leucyl aminopeptidase [Spirulina sp. SIO3F2]